MEDSLIAKFVWNLLNNIREGDSKAAGVCADNLGSLLDVGGEPLPSKEDMNLLLAKYVMVNVLPDMTGEERMSVESTAPATSVQAQAANLVSQILPKRG